MGCDIHYSIERVSQQYYRKNKINKLVIENEDKLSFKEYCEEEKKNIKKYGYHFILIGFIISINMGLMTLKKTPYILHKKKYIIIF